MFLKKNNRKSHKLLTAQSQTSVSSKRRVLSIVFSQIKVNNGTRNVTKNMVQIGIFKNKQCHLIYMHFSPYSYIGIFNTIRNLSTRI